MSITYSEKNQFIKNTKSIAEELVLKLDSYDNSVLLFKVVAHALRNNENIVQEFDESIFDDRELFCENFDILLQHAITVACTTTDSVAKEEKKKVAEYTPSQLAKYFGVSTMTIHNWLESKRFVGIKKAGENKHNWISEETIFITSSGNKIPVSEVVKMWHKQEADVTNKEVLNVIKTFIDPAVLENGEAIGSQKRALIITERMIIRGKSDEEIHELTEIPIIEIQSIRAQLPFRDSD